jgi:hypothetical protein
MDFTQSFDALVWAAAFKAVVEANPEIATDEATLQAWFANALMRGYDEHARKYRAERLINAVGHYDLASERREHLGKFIDRIMEEALAFGRPHVDPDGIKLDVASGRTYSPLASAK